MDLYKNEPEFKYDEEEDENDSENDSEEENFYCEICDREFESLETLDRHIQEHQTCKIDGCTFTAHPKIVEKHISMQHATGLYQRMKNAMSDGDLEKWKAERKKRFPTTTNKRLKEEEQLEKEKRGEVVKDHNEKKSGRFKFGDKDKIKKNRKRKRNKHSRDVVTKKPTIEKIVQTYRGLLPFAGTAMLDHPTESKIESSKSETVIDDEIVTDKVPSNDDLNEIEISDDENFQVIVEKPVVIQKPKLDTLVPKICGLVADYGSDSDNDEPPEEVPSKKIKNEEEEKLDCQNLVPNNESVQVPVDVKVESKLNRNQSSTKKQNTSDKNQFQRASNSKCSAGRTRLLDRLLARSIQHERNAIFQCITFIKNNNFFD